MKIFEQLARQRNWAEDEGIILDQVRRVADQVIAPNAQRFDKANEFPWENLRALNQLGQVRW